jgi:hypothetical protein
MKLITLLLISASAYSMEPNCYIFPDRDENMKMVFFLEKDGHFYEIGIPKHSEKCPCED